MPPKQERPHDGQQAEDVPDPKAGFGGCDLSLLQSGEHADIRLECGDRMFDCHRAILAARSGWFKEKITELNQLPPFVDGSLPVIQILNPSSEDVQVVLVFIYAGEVDPRAMNAFGQPTEPALKAHIRLFNLGYDFRVTGLADYASDEIGKTLSAVLQMICDQRLTNQRHPNGRTELQDRLRRNNFVQIYLDGVEAADWVRRQGATEAERVRPFQMLVDFFIAGKDVLLREPEMGLFLEDDLVPSFAKSVLLTERRTGQYHSSWMRELVVKPQKHVPGRKGLCWDCGGGVKNIRETGGIALVNPKSKEVAYTQVCCVRCAEKESNLDSYGFIKWGVFDAKKD